MSQEESQEGGENSVSALERHCRLLSRAYPAVYRQEHGEQITSTLLEATPVGRSWPLARDICGLAVGSLRARAALNQRLTAGANLGIAVVAGAATYLAYSATNDLIFGVMAVAHRVGYAHVAAWPPLLAGALLGPPVALVWLSRRRAVFLACVVVAAVAVSLVGYWRSAFAWPLPELACLAALALLAGRAQRPGRGWLWPVALAVAWLVMAHLVPGGWQLWTLAPLEAIGIIGVLWAVIDARPAVAIAVFLLALWLPAGLASLVPADIGAEMPLLIAMGLAAVAVWRLRRQSARVTARGGS